MRHGVRGARSNPAVCLLSHEPLRSDIVKFVLETILPAWDDESNLSSSSRGQGDSTQRPPSRSHCLTPLEQTCRTAYDIMQIISAMWPFHLNATLRCFLSPRVRFVFWELIRARNAQGVFEVCWPCALFAPSYLTHAPVDPARPSTRCGAENPGSPLSGLPAARWPGAPGRTPKHPTIGARLARKRGGVQIRIRRPRTRTPSRVAQTRRGHHTEDGRIRDQTVFLGCFFGGI